MARYSEDQKIKALSIAKKIGAAEAAKATGIPAGTIRSWIHRSEYSEKKKKPAKIDSKKLHKLQHEVMEKAVNEAGDYVADRLKSLADRLYRLAEKSVTKVDIAISDKNDLIPDGEVRAGILKDRDGAAWLRSLVGVMSQSIDKAQLLSGKPTVRPEVNNKHVYEITQRIINDKESVELAEQLLRRAAGSNAGSLRLHGDGRPMDTI